MGRMASRMGPNVSAVSTKCAVARIPREVHASARARYQKTHPKVSLSIDEPASGEMTAAFRNDRDRLDVERLTPVELAYTLDPVSFEHRTIAQPDDELGIVLFRERIQGGDVHMIVVVVTDEDKIDRRKLGECQSRGMTSAWTDKREGARAFGPDRVGQQVDAVELNECRGVVDESDP